MPVENARLTVSEIRQEIYKASGSGAQGAGSTAGQIFHLVAAAALDPTHPACWKSGMTAALDEPAWLSLLYEQVVGPELHRLHGALANNGAEVEILWRAVQQYVHWVRGLLEEAVQQGNLRYYSRRETWIGAETMFQTECDVERRYLEPEWKRPVVVSGRADQFLRSGPDRWCVIELKLGAGHPEADAAQACLYQELLGGGGDAALLHFGNGNGAEEILFSKSSMLKARPALLALIAKMAGASDAGPHPVHTPQFSGQQPPPSTPSWHQPPGNEENEIGKLIERTLQEYGAEARLAAEPVVGPSFVRYLLEPLHGIPVSRIERCGPNLQVRLGLTEEPVIHRVDGRVAMDVRRRERGMVTFASLRAALEAAGSEDGCSELLAGVDLRSEIHKLDVARDCAHILVGGHAGSGKTEWLRAAVASLLIANTPGSLRLAVVDPKKNAFTELAGSPFLWREDALVDSPNQLVLDLLMSLIEEMTRRNALLGNAAADDLTQYRKKTGEKLPRIVVVVDEFAELLLFGGRKQRDAFEQAFIRIAAVGRSAGIHLILATQRPSRQVVSGNLKANLPGKIALKVATRVDSGVLIDRPGAELLLGSGDLLLAGLTAQPVRLQSAYLSEEERSLIFKGLARA